MVNNTSNYLLQPLLRLLALNIFNINKVPIPFKFLDGYIYYIYSKKTVTGKTD